MVIDISSSKNLVGVWCYWFMLIYFWDLGLGDQNWSFPTRTILRKLAPVFQRKGLVLEVELVDSVSGMHRSVSTIPYWSEQITQYILWLQLWAKIRNWTKLMPSSATLRNCYRSRKTDAETNFRVPQSFSFFPREGRTIIWFLRFIYLSKLTFYIFLPPLHPTYPGQLCRTMASASPRKRMCLAVWEGRVMQGTSSLWWKDTCPTPVWSKIPYWFGHNHWCQLQRTFGIEWMLLMKWSNNP